MSDIRLWHPAQDAYHGAFRMLRIMLAKQEPRLELEKLYLLDFFMVYPFLLHKIHMTRSVKTAFYELRIQKPEDYFISLPSNLSLFRDMGVIQLEAAKTLVGKGLFDRESFLNKTVQLVQEKTPDKLKKLAAKINEESSSFMNFLVNDLGRCSLDELRLSTELRRRLI